MGQKKDRSSKHSSSESGRERENVNDIRRLEQWSSLDSCIIANRTRIPSIPSANITNKENDWNPGDLQIALNLLRIESNVSPSKHHHHGNLATSRVSSEAICSSIDTDPFRTRTPSVATSSQGKISSSTTSSHSGSVLVHSKDIAKLEKVLRRHSIPHLHLDGCCDRNHQSGCEHDSESPLKAQHGEATQFGSQKSAHPSAQPDADKGAETKTDVRHLLNPRRLRTSSTCPALRLEDSPRSPRLAHSSRSVKDLAKSASIANLRILRRDYPFRNHSVKDLARKLGVNIIELPVNLTPNTLGLPICYARPVNYLIKANTSARKVFAVQPNPKLVDAYYLTFADLMRGVEDDWKILATVAGAHFPQTKRLSKFDKVQCPAEVGAALIKMLSELPNGIIGSASVFNQLYLSLHNWQRSRTDLDQVDDQPLTRFIAKVITEITDILQLHLICAIFGLMCSLKKSDRDILILARAIAPVMLNTGVEQIELGDSKAVKCKINSFRSRCRRILGLPLKDPMNLRRLEACEYLAARLLKLWPSILKQMMALEEQGSPVEVEDTQGNGFRRLSS